MLSTIFQKSSNGQQLLERVFTHMDILERDYFGLKYLDVNSVSQWLDPRKPIRKQSKDKGKLTQALILFQIATDYIVGLMKTYYLQFCEIFHC